MLKCCWFTRKVQTGGVRSFETSAQGQAIADRRAVVHDVHRVSRHSKSNDQFVYDVRDPRERVRELVVGGASRWPNPG
jgi:hypothetical protein